MKCQKVNADPLTPGHFLNRSATVFGNWKSAVVYGELRYTYLEFQARVNRLAGALKLTDAGKGDRVAFICPNTPPMLEAHFAAPMIGAILVSINIRLSPPEVTYILNHSEAKAVFVDNDKTT